MVIADADYFGNRAQLSTQIQAKDGMWSQISAFFGPIIGDVWAHFFGRQSTFYCAALCVPPRLQLLAHARLFPL